MSRKNLGARKKSAKNQRARELKSAKFKAQKRARKRQCEELRPRARSVKKSACPALPTGHLFPRARIEPF